MATRNLEDPFLFFRGGDAAFDQADVVGRRELAAAGFEEVGDLHRADQLQQFLLQIEDA
jgi:hypothetical protein